jgi:hypothetical protein
MRLQLPEHVDGETTAQRGLRLFLFVMEHGSAGAGELGADDIALTRYAARLATDARERSTAYYDRVADTERILSGRARAIAANDARELAERATGAQPAPSAPAPGSPTPYSDRDNLGPMAPLRPVTVPRGPAPAGAVAPRVTSIAGW